MRGAALRRSLKRFSRAEASVRCRSTWAVSNRRFCPQQAQQQVCYAGFHRPIFSSAVFELPRTRNVAVRKQPVEVAALEVEDEETEDLSEDEENADVEQEEEEEKEEAEVARSCGDLAETDEECNEEEEGSLPPQLLKLEADERRKQEQDELDVLPTVIILGRPNVGKSALFNRLIGKKEAVVYDTPKSHVTRDIREGVARISDLRFKLLDSAGLEISADEEGVLARTRGLTANFLPNCHIALLVIDGRAGLHPVDREVGQWIRRFDSKVPVVVIVNKAERMIEDVTGSVISTIGESYTLGFGDPVPVSAETGAGMVDLYSRLSPLVAEARKVLEEEKKKGENSGEKPMQFAIAGRPNVGKSTLINTLLQKQRVLTGPEPGLTRDSIRVDFEFEKRPVYLVDTAGWLPKSQLEEGPVALSAMFTRRSIQRSHVVALVLDGEEIAKTKRALRHSEASLARWVAEEGRALVIIVNKMDVVEGKENAKLREQVMEAVPKEIQLILPQITGVPIVFVSALKGRGRTMIMKRAFESYNKWCTRIPTPKLNRWLYKVMARHPQRKDERRAKPRFLTQVKARPPTFVIFVAGFYKLENHELRFFANALREDFNLDGIPLRVIQRTKKELEGV